MENKYSVPIYAPDALQQLIAIHDLPSRALSGNEKNLPLGRTLHRLRDAKFAIGDLLHQKWLFQRHEHIRDRCGDADKELRLSGRKQSYTPMHEQRRTSRLHQRIQKNRTTVLGEQGKHRGEEGRVPVGGRGVAEVVRGVDDEEGVNLLVNVMTKTNKRKLGNAAGIVEQVHDPLRVMVHVGKTARGQNGDAIVARSPP